MRYARSRAVLLPAAHRCGGLARHRPRRIAAGLVGPHRDEPRTSDLVLAVLGVALLAGLGLVALAAIGGAPLHP